MKVVVAVDNAEAEEWASSEAGVQSVVAEEEAEVDASNTVPTVEEVAGDVMAGVVVVGAGVQPFAVAFEVVSVVAEEEGDAVERVRNVANPVVEEAERQ